MDLARITTTVDVIYYEGYRRIEKPLCKVAASSCVTSKAKMVRNETTPQFDNRH